LEETGRSGGQRAEVWGGVLPHANDELLEEEERERAAPCVGRAPVDARPPVHRAAEATGRRVVHARGEPDRKPCREAVGQEGEARLTPSRVPPVDQPDALSCDEYVAPTGVPVPLRPVDGGRAG